MEYGVKKDDVGDAEEHALYAMVNKKVLNEVFSPRRFKPNFNLR